MIRGDKPILLRLSEAMMNLEYGEQKAAIVDFYDSLDEAEKEQMRAELLAVKQDVMRAWVDLELATVYRGAHVRNVTEDILDTARRLERQYKDGRWVSD